MLPPSMKAQRVKKPWYTRIENPEYIAPLPPLDVRNKTKKQSRAVLIINSSIFPSTTSRKGPTIANGPVITTNDAVR